MADGQTFVPGEVAVLRNRTGGRLFIVERQYGSDVFEKPWIYGQPFFKVRAKDLVKCAHADEAQSIVDQLHLMDNFHRAIMQGVERSFIAACDRICASVKR